MGERSERPVLAQSAGSYREWLPAPPLRGHFRCTWTHRLAPDLAAPVLVVPDGCIDLMWMDGSLHVAGPDRAPQPASLRPGATIVGLRFSPGAAAAWLRVSASALTDRRVPLDAIAAAEARRLVAAVGDRRDPADVARALEAAVAARASAVAPGPVDMRAAFRLIGRGAPAGQPLVRWLGRELELSERTLRRRFEEAFGYGPKTLDRILRFQRFLALARQSPDVTAAMAAAEAGYADQPHMVREVRRLSAHTPGEIARLLARRKES